MICKLKAILKDKIIKKRLIIIAVVVITLYYVIFTLLIRPQTQKENFQNAYLQSLTDIFEENSWELVTIEFPKLIPDREKEYFERERVNEYVIYVYVNGEQFPKEKIYEALYTIRSRNQYLLSNTYERLSAYAYADDDCNEKGFHKIYTILIFEDKNEYRIVDLALYKNDEAIYRAKDNFFTSSNSYYNGDECNYPECDHKKAEGKPYCHQHKCNESGCNNSTDLLPSYCNQHNCTYDTCTAPQYKAVNSTYCQRHYIETYR